MADIKDLHARLRKRKDRDIKQAIKRLNMEEIELSDLVRDGLRIKLTELGVLEGKERSELVGERKIVNSKA